MYYFDDFETKRNGAFTTIPMSLSHSAMANSMDWWVKQVVLDKIFLHKEPLDN
jgi:hypothetical protein